MEARGSSKTLFAVRALVLLVAAAALGPIYMVTGAAAFTRIERLKGLVVELDKELAGFEGQLKVLEARAMGDGSVRPSPAISGNRSQERQRKLSPGQAGGVNRQPESPGTPGPIPIPYPTIVQGLQTSVEKMQDTTGQLEKEWGATKDQRGILACRKVQEQLNGLGAALTAVRKAGNDQQEFQRAFGEVKSQFALLLPAVQKVREAAARPVPALEHKGQ